MATKKLLPVLTILIFSALIVSGNSISKTEKIPDTEIIQNPEDSVIFQKVITRFQGKKLSVGELIIAIGKSFEGTPYVANTLENNPEEKLVVNLREFDCTTFAENCLALARTIKSGNPTYRQFLQNLQQIRYRNGKRNQYPSRLHYFSDWLYNNAEKNIISLPVTANSSDFPNHVNFMSKHPESYQCLKTNAEFIGQIEQTENNISARKYFFIPKEKVAATENELHEGDIAGITTNISGLDIVHTVLLTRVNGRIHILHASSSAKKVVLSDEPLADYLAKHKIQTGIMVGRPLE